jgi:hypothetical protein
VSAQSEPPFADEPKAFSHALLPIAGVAVAMKAGDDQEGIGFNEEKERVGKFLCARSTESLKDGGELPRIASMRRTTLSIWARKRGPS